MAEATTREKVEAVLNELRPALQFDGGDIELLGIEDNVVKVRLVGSCRGCPSSMMTLQYGVERAIIEAVPEISRVEAEPF